MDAQLKRGLLEICVLAALMRRDSYGYQIIKDVSAVIEISESTLYPILKRLLGAQCLTEYSMEHGGRLRKYYHLTGDGRTRVQEFLDNWHRIMEIHAFIEGGMSGEEN